MKVLATKHVARPRRYCQRGLEPPTGYTSDNTVDRHTSEDNTERQHKQLKRQNTNRAWRAGSKREQASIIE